MINLYMTEARPVLAINWPDHPLVPSTTREFNRAQRVSAKARQRHSVHASEPPTFEPSGSLMCRARLVLCHQDLNMRNIIVGDDGRLWQVDWTWAGFYRRGSSFSR